jgi:thiamine pyrophosphate-dependent acetolactate synthase large subunit-like protein
MRAQATRPLGAQIAHMLKGRGVDVIFGIPRVHNQKMYRGIEQAGITYVMARHQQGAGWAGQALTDVLDTIESAPMCTYAERGIADPLHFGACLPRPGSKEVIASVDLVIAVGTELAEVDQ